MTEKEKMLSGALYNPNCGDPELSAEHARCAALCRAYNQLPPGDEAGRRALMTQLLGGTGARFTINQPFLCDYGYNIKVGENFYVNYNCVILDCAPVTFGDNVFIAPNCGFYTAGHPLDAATRNTGLEFARPITVEDDVWIGGGVSVLPGVTIGRGSVIGAGSVVTRDIPAGVVAAGNPCRVIRAVDPV